MTAAILLATTLGVAACNDGNSDTKATTIMMTTAFAEVSEGQTVEIEAIVDYKASDRSVEWTSSDPAVATVAAKTEFAEGETASPGIAVVTGVKVGTATITATTKDGSNLSDICTVTVTERNDALFSFELNMGKDTEGNDVFNTIEIFRDHMAVGGVAYNSAIAIPIDNSPTEIDYTIADNDFDFAGATITVMSVLNMPVLHELAALPDGGFSLRLYTNNGEADFEFGTMEFTAEDAQTLGIDPSTLGAAAKAQATGTFTTMTFLENGQVNVELHSEMGGAVLLSFSCTTDYTVTDGKLSIATAEDVEMDSMLGKATADITFTVNNLNIDINSVDETGTPTLRDTVAFTYDDAKDKMGMDVEWVGIESITVTPAEKEIKSGETFDVSTLVNVMPADATDASYTLSLSVEDAAKNVVAINGTSVVGMKAGTVNVIITGVKGPDETEAKTATLQVTVVLPEKSEEFENSVTFDQQTVFFGTVIEMEGVNYYEATVFKTDGTMERWSVINSTVSLSSLGYYTLNAEKTQITYKAFADAANTQAQLTTADGVTSYTIDVGEGATRTYATGKTFAADKTLKGTFSLSFGEVSLEQQWAISLKANGEYAFTVDDQQTGSGTYMTVADKHLVIYSEKGIEYFAYTTKDGAVSITVSGVTMTEDAAK